MHTSVASTPLSAYGQACQWPLNEHGGLACLSLGTLPLHIDYPRVGRFALSQLHVAQRSQRLFFGGVLLAGSVGYACRYAMPGPGFEENSGDLLPVVDGRWCPDIARFADPTASESWLGAAVW
jgi:hypothetical protein